MATDLTSNESRSFSTAAAHSESQQPELDSHVAVDDAFDRFRNWIHSKSFPKRTRISFIQGVLEAEMSPESLFDHNFVKVAVNGALWAIGEQEQYGRVFSDRALLINQGLKIATEPDVMFCLWSTIREKKMEYRSFKSSRKGAIEVHGCPDLVVEIVSNSSVKKDKVLLRQGYFAIGIPEYWLIDARNGRLEFTIFQRGDQEYLTLPAGDDGFCFSNIFNRAFQLERYADPNGEDTYRLLSKKTPL